MVTDPLLYLLSHKVGHMNKAMSTPRWWMKYFVSPHQWYFLSLYLWKTQNLTLNVCISLLKLSIGSLTWRTLYYQLIHQCQVELLKMSYNVMNIALVLLLEHSVLDRKSDLVLVNRSPHSCAHAESLFLQPWIFCSCILWKGTWLADDRSWLMSTAWVILSICLFSASFWWIFSWGH